MNEYVLGGFTAFFLFFMGVSAFYSGLYNYIETNASKASKWMFLACVCVFFWNFGYGWMSLCYHSDMAYVARAISLLSIIFYMIFTILYVGEVANFHSKIGDIFLLSMFLLSAITWPQIIQKDAVSFQITPWGYWYTSKMSWARIVQFTTIFAVIAYYYVIINYGYRRATKNRERYILKQFCWFGVALFAGYSLDTLIPTLLHTAAVPGSCIGAFASSMILFRISKANKAFGLSSANVSNYVFQKVNIPVIITNESDHIELTNDYAKEYFKAIDQQLIGLTLNDLVSEFEGDYLTTKEDHRICSVNITKVNDQFGDLQYSIFFLNDVTQERETMHMLEESRIEAEAASKAKSNFLANMSHEIRTPMNAIIGMSEIVLQEENLSSKIKEQVSEIHVAGNSLLGIINDILDISKIEAGKIELIEVEYELASMLNEIENIICVRLQDTNVKFELYVEETIPKILYGDNIKVRQILLNVLGNAVKFTHKGSITLELDWDHNETDPVITAVIKDTGIGIREEDCDKIFGAFNQVDTRKNRSIQGTGLGLAISKQLSNMMDGDLWVESIYGQGSTFYMQVKQAVHDYQPMGKEVADALRENRYQTHINKHELTLVPRPDCRVLVVDDTKVNLMVAKGIMGKYQLQIDMATSGQEAIDMVQENNYDLVFMDHMMPEMDGIDAIGHIRTLGAAYANLPIIMLTANVIGDAKNMFLESGAQGFLGKPINLVDLDEILNQWLPT